MRAPGKLLPETEDLSRKPEILDHQCLYGLILMLQLVILELAESFFFFYLDIMR